MPLHTPKIRFPGFVAFFAAIVPAQNKYMGLVFNSSSAGLVVAVSRIAIIGVVSSTTEVALDVEVRRITAYTSGTPVMPVPLDARFSLGAGIAADTNASPVTDSSLVRRVTATTQNPQVSAGEWLGAAQGYGYALFEELDAPIILRQNQGVAVKNITNTNTNSMSYAIEFTQLGG